MSEKNQSEVCGEWVTKHFTKEMEEFAIECTTQLIQCAPFNPPGNEKRIAALAAHILKNAGFQTSVEEFQENRCNVTATIGNPDDIALILNGHLDVVPPYGTWERDPVNGERKNGIIYGRGSCDMLGGCSAILTAARLFGESNAAYRLKRGVMVLLVSDEEDMNRGIRHVLSKGRLRADCAIIAEPTECEIHLGNRGFSSFYISTSGVGCHASEPWNGVNAIYKMGEIIRRLENYAGALVNVTNEYLGQATCCIGTIKGGVRLNTVPDYCEIEVERRLLPGETPLLIQTELEEIVGELGEVRERSFFPASLISVEHPAVKQCREMLRGIRKKEPGVDVFKGCTEASMFSVYNKIPTLIVGPGSLKQAHRVNEFCAEQDIIDCAKLFAGLIYKYLS